MPNTFLTPQIIAMEALAILKNNLVMADLVHSDYSSEFVKVGDTITVRKPAVLVAKDFAGNSDVQDLVEEGVAVKMERFKDISVKLTSKQETLELKDFARQVIEPAMVALAEQIDSDLANFAFGASVGAIGAASATPTSLADIANAAKYLDNVKAPVVDRHLVMSPDHKYRYALTNNLSYVNYAGDNATLREALLGRIFALNTYMDQNMPKSSAAVSGTVKGVISVASGTANNVTLSAGLPADGTLKIGDGFIFGGILYRFVADHTLTSGGKANVAVSPNFPAGVSVAVSVPVVRNSSSVAFHRNAFAFVNRPLDLPMGAARAAIANGEGMSVRVVYGYDQVTKQDTISFDIIYGIAALRPELAVRIYDNF
jgi:hypothetical protein